MPANPSLDLATASFSDTLLASGFSLVEALLAIGVSVVLMAVLYSMLVTSRRGMVRGEGKLEYIGEASALFQSLRKDMQSLREPPAWDPALSRLEVPVWHIKREPYTAIPRNAIYVLDEGTVRRELAAAGVLAADPPRTFGSEKIVSMTVEPGTLRGAQFIAVTLTFRIEAEPNPTSFSKVLFLRNLRTDPTWVPLPGG